ncbi:MAG: ferredoxin [Oscillospiraceae bacterium]|jgi:ferredoxin
MKARVDKEVCIGCEICPSICPEIFTMGPDGKAHAAQDPVTSENEDEVLDAQASCPVNAISVSG